MTISRSASRAAVPAARNAASSCADNPAANTGEFLQSIDDELTSVTEAWLVHVGVPRDVIDAEIEAHLQRAPLGEVPEVGAESAQGAVPVAATPYRGTRTSAEVKGD